MIKMLTVFLLAVPAASLAKAEDLTTMEKLYLDQLQSWLDDGAEPMTVQERVIAPCSKLVMLSATAVENASFLARQEIEEYDFRASFCMKATVNQVYPQPDFHNSGMIREVCTHSQLVCAKYRLR